MIDRVRIVGENLVAAITVQSRRGSAGDRIEERVGGYLIALAIGVCHGDGMSAGVHRLDRIASLAEVDSARAHVSHFEDPALGEFPLQRQVPLLRIGNHEVPRHLEHE